MHNMIVEEHIPSSDRMSTEFYEVCDDVSDDNESDDNESIQSTFEVDGIKKHELVGDFDTFDIIETIC